MSSKISRGACAGPRVFSSTEGAILRGTGATPRYDWCPAPARFRLRPAQKQVAYQMHFKERFKASTLADTEIQENCSA